MAAASARRGFTLFLTGLPGAGKTTLAGRLKEVLESQHARSVTVLDDPYGPAQAPDRSWTPAG